MAFDSGTAYVDVLPQTAAVGLRLRHELGASRNTGIARKAGILLGGAVALGVGGAVIGIGKLLTSSIGAAIEADKVTAQTRAALKSTGEAANVSLKHVQNLAQEIMNYSGISDEAVQSAENLLLTFTNIRNEVGKGNDIFDQATIAVTDMSVALDQDLKSSSIQLGKALNDPIAGITSLSRVGVKFTEETREQIAVMVESGNIMGAQKIILAELTKEFGGSAKAIGNTQPWVILQQQLGNVLEQIGMALLPTIKDLSKEISKFVQSKEFQAWLQDAIKWVKEIVRNLIVWAREAWPEVKENIINVMNGLREFWDDWGSHIIQGIRLVVGFLVTQWKRNVTQLMVIIHGIRVAVNFISDTWDFLKRITGDLLAGLVRAWRNFLEFFFKIAEGILNAASNAFGWIPGIGDRIARFRERFGNMTTGILNDLGRQADEFDRWGETSRKNIAGVNTEIGQLIKNLKGVSAPGTIRAEFVGGDGPGAMGMMGGLAASWARQAIAAVPGPQGISNTYRTPAQNAAVGGSPTSYHLDRNNPAADISGSNLMGIFNWLVGHVGRSAREIIYTPAGYSIQHGARAGNIGDHYDHVHVAKHGWHGQVNKPSLFLAGEAGSERVDITPSHKMGRKERYELVITNWDEGTGYLTRNVVGTIDKLVMG